jgi:plastocyanin
MRFFPSVLKVRSGDTVHFGTNTFETATLLPASLDANSFIENEWNGTTSKWSPFLSNPDHGPAAIKANLRVLIPSYQCGWPGQPVCDFDASGTSVDGVLNSGLALYVYNDNLTGKKRLSFNVRITAPPGTTFDVLSLIHPTMVMQIQVVSEGETASEQSGIDAEMSNLLAVDKATVASIDAKYRTKRDKITSHGNTIWLARAGIDTAHVSIRRMYPAKLVIQPGDRVRWKFDKLIHETHSVSIPSGRALSVSGEFPQIVCDPDGDEGTAPDSPPDSSSPPYCSDAQQLEVKVPERMVGTVGDAVYPGKDPLLLDSSGVRGASFAKTSAPYTVRFNKRSSERGFGYTSMIDHIAHVAMTGVVVVRP